MGIYVIQNCSRFLAVRGCSSPLQSFLLLILKSDIINICINLYLLVLEFSLCTRLVVFLVTSLFRYVHLNQWLSTACCPKEKNCPPRLVTLPSSSSLSGPFLNA